MSVEVRDILVVVGVAASVLDQVTMNPIVGLLPIME